MPKPSSPTGSMPRCFSVISCPGQPRLQLWPRGRRRGHQHARPPAQCPAASAKPPSSSCAGTWPAESSCPAWPSAAWLAPNLRVGHLRRHPLIPKSRRMQWRRPRRPACQLGLPLSARPACARWCRHRRRPGRRPGQRCTPAALLDAITHNAQAAQVAREFEATHQAAMLKLTVDAEL